MLYPSYIINSPTKYFLVTLFIIDPQATEQMIKNDILSSLGLKLSMEPKRPVQSKVTLTIYVLLTQHKTHPTVLMTSSPFLVLTSQINNTFRKASMFPDSQYVHEATVGSFIVHKTEERIPFSHTLRTCNHLPWASKEEPADASPNRRRLSQFLLR